MAELWEYEGNILQPKFDRSLRVKKLLLKYSAEYLVNPDFATLKPTSLITKQHLLDYGGGGTPTNMNPLVFDGDGSIGSPYTLINYADGKQYANVDGAWVEVVAGVGGVVSVQAGTNITVDNTDPANPIVSAIGGGGDGTGGQLYIFNNLGRTI